MKIAVCSMFRDSVYWHGRYINQISRYFEQLQNQINFDGSLDFYLLEGDSKDNTSEALQDYRCQFKNIKYLDINNNTKEIFNGMKSTQKRLVTLSSLGDKLLNRVAVENYDFLLWIESDLIISNELISNLLHARNFVNTPGAVAPYVMIHNQFYDTWGFIDMTGNNWSAQERPEHKICEMLSVGSCALIDFRFIKNGARFSPNAFQSLCKSIISMGGKIYCDKSHIIKHPDFSLQNRWV